MIHRYRIEEVDVAADPTSPAARRRRRRSTAATGSWLGTGLSYNTLDGAIPLRGSRLELLAEASGPEVGSEYKLVRFGARADHAMSLGPLTLRVHGHATYIHSDDPGGVQLSERLFHDAAGIELAHPARR